MNKDYMKEEWFSVLTREIENSSQRRVADKLGYSMTAINLVVHGKYKGKTEKIAAQVMRVYTNIKCPFSGNVITLKDCRDTAHAAAPTHNPIKMGQWKACLKCPNRPD